MSKKEQKEQTQKSGLAMAGFVVSIIALVLSPVPIINNLAFVLAIVALIFGIVTLKKDSKGKIATILSVIAIVIVIVAQLFFGKVLDDAGKELEKAGQEITESAQRSSGEKTDEILKNDVSVEIGAFNVVEEEYTTTTSLPVAVKNKHSERKSYSITIEAVDAEGNRIEEDTLYVNELGSGQTENVKAFEYVSSEKVDALKKATFKVITVTQN